MILFALAGALRPHHSTRPLIQRRCHRAHTDPAHPQRHPLHPLSHRWEWATQHQREIHSYRLLAVRTRIAVVISIPAGKKCCAFCFLAGHSDGHVVSAFISMIVYATRSVPLRKERSERTKRPEGRLCTSEHGLDQTQYFSMRLTRLLRYASQSVIGRAACPSSQAAFATATASHSMTRGSNGLGTM